MQPTVSARPLTVEGFSPFGQVISAGLKQGSAANQGTAVRFDWCANLANGRPNARPNLAVFRSTPLHPPIQIRLLERHPQNTQAFMPMLVSRFLIIAAPNLANGAPDLDNLKAFLCAPGQGINYNSGVWHHPIIALDAAAEFAMLAWEDGTALDCEEYPLEVPVWVTVDSVDAIRR